MQRTTLLISVVASCGLLAGLASCTDDHDAKANASDSGAPLVDASPGADATVTDSAPPTVDAGPPVVSVLATFDQSAGQLPEGLWEITPSATEFVGTTGTPILGFAPLATTVTIGADGHSTSFGSLSATPQSTYTLGVTSDATGNVYFAVAAAAAPPNDPAPGIYEFGPAGGTPTPFSLGSNVTPAMNFANGLDFKGTNLFVADSEGVIYEIDPAGVASVWSQDPLLAPSMSACSGMVPLPIGANGIVHDANAFYVTNTDYGRIVKIGINADGSAGTATVLKEDCASLVGADGILIDPSDDSFIIALNVKNQVVRVAHDGSAVTVIASGAPLFTPASPLLDTVGGKKRILVTGSGFFSSPDAGAPNLVQIVFP